MYEWKILLIFKQINFQFFSEKEAFVYLYTKYTEI